MIDSTIFTKISVFILLLQKPGKKIYRSDVCTPNTKIAEMV